MTSFYYRNVLGKITIYDFSSRFGGFLSHFFETRERGTSFYSEREILSISPSETELHFAEDVTAVGEDKLLGTVLGAVFVPGTGKAGVAVDPEMMGHDFFFFNSSRISDGQRFPGFDGGDENWVDRRKDSKNWRENAAKSLPVKFSHFFQK